MTRLSLVAAASAALVTTTGAQAQPNSPSSMDDGARLPSSSAPASGYPLSFRAEAGLGPGSVGFAERATLSSEGWLGTYIGVGGFGGVSHQDSVCVFCAHTSEALQFFGVALAARTAPRGSYGLFTVGAGYAWGQRQTTDSDGFFDLYGPSMPPQTETTRVGGVLFTGSGAWVWHLGSLEVGPATHVDVTTWGGVTVTVNVALGFVLP